MLQHISLPNVTLHLRASKNLCNVLVRQQKPAYASIFACIENEFSPEEEYFPADESETPSVPILVSFGPDLAPLAHLTLKTETRFTVRGRLNFFSETERHKGGFSLHARELHLDPRLIEAVLALPCPDPSP